MGCTGSTSVQAHSELLGFEDHYVLGNTIHTGSSSVLKEAKLRKEAAVSSQKSYANTPLCVKVITKPNSTLDPQCVTTSPLQSDDMDFNSVFAASEESKAQDDLCRLPGDSDKDPDGKHRQRGRRGTSCSNSSTASTFDDGHRPRWVSPHAEIQIMERTKHPNVVHLLEWFSNDSSVHMVLQKCACSLSVCYPQGVEKIPLVAKYHHQLTSAVVYLHDLIVLHGDIKPDHIMLTSASEKDSNIQLCDFRVAVQLSHKEEMVEAFVSTKNYSAPEMLRHNEQGLASDVWAAGCTLFWTLLGTCPFEVIENCEGKGMPHRSLRPGSFDNDVDKDMAWKQHFRDLAGAICNPRKGSPLVRHSRIKDKTIAELVELMRGMLNVQADCRMTSEEVEMHPWTTHVSKTEQEVDKKKVARRP